MIVAQLVIDERPHGAFRRTYPLYKGGEGFHLWSNLLDDEAPHRQVLERFAEAYPQASIILPPYERYEDYVECYGRWNSASVWIYYETILSSLWLWSKDREAVVAMRTALMPFAA